MKLKKNKISAPDSESKLEIEKSLLADLRGNQLFQNVSKSLAFQKFPEEWSRALGCSMPLKGAVYPILLEAQEEYHLPLSGQEHWVVCVIGHLQLVERLSGRENSIRPTECVHISRKDLLEYPNLKVISNSIPSKALWIIGHRI